MSKRDAAQEDKMTTATKTQKTCEECGQPAATGRTMNLGGEKVHARLHTGCKKIVEARHAEWLACESAVTAQPTDTGLIYGCDAAGSAWIRANVGLD